MLKYCAVLLTITFLSIPLSASPAILERTKKSSFDKAGILLYNMIERCVSPRAGEIWVKFGEV